MVISQLIKTMIVTPTPVDAVIIGILGITYLGAKSIEVYNKYLEAKNAVLSENEFRTKVIEDIQANKSALGLLQLGTQGNPFKPRR